MPLIEIIAESTDDYLTTTAAVKLALGTTSTANDAEISSAILSASRWAQTYVGYPLVARRYREQIAGYGTRSLLLARTPIRSVVALWDRETTDGASPVATSEMQIERKAGLIRRPQGWEWSAPSEPWLTNRPLVGQEFPAWLADYVAGYTYAGIDTGSALWSTVAGSTSTGRTLPEDIEEAVIRKAVGFYEGSEDVVEEAVGDLRVRYGSFGQSAQRPDRAAILLGPYKRVV